MGSLSEEVRTEVLCGHICDLEAENANLREFATETWELLTCNEPVFVWKGLQELARNLGIEVDECYELKPCPFCGGKARIHRWSIPNEENCAQVRCESITCGARGYEACECMTQDEVDEIAIAAWNRRAES